MAAVLPIRPDDRDIIATEARNIAASMRVIEAIAGFGKVVTVNHEALKALALEMRNSGRGTGGWVV